MEADPIVITRYWYRPARGFPDRFNDNKHLHLFVADVAGGAVTQLTDGRYYEHSVDWSPDGRKLLFVSNHERSEEHTSELQSLMRISYAVLCLKKKNIKQTYHIIQQNRNNHNPTNNDTTHRTHMQQEH